MSLTIHELADLRRQMARAVATVPWKKERINAALEAIEDWFESNRASLGQAIEAAAPSTFGPAQKKALVAYWLEQKFRREVA